MKPNLRTQLYLQEVEAVLWQAAPKKTSSGGFDLQHYVGTKMTITGLSIPAHRALHKKGYSFSDSSSDEQFAIWKYIWFNSTLHDALTQAILFCDTYIKNVAPVEFWPEIKTWITRIDNWAHSDGLTHYYAALLESLPATVYPQLLIWNRSHNPWERRQSVLSLLDYARFRKKAPAFNKIIPLVENLLTDDNHFVQKGIGWCLRETDIVYPEKTREWLQHNYAFLSSTAFATATEKILPAEKERLKKLRKKVRKKG